VGGGTAGYPGGARLACRRCAARSANITCLLRSPRGYDACAAAVGSGALDEVE
jgi:hypothetical protein